MANIRNKTHPKGFTVLDNRGLNCPDISFRATGLWAFVKGKPDDWEIAIAHLAGQKTEGRDAIYKAIAELVKAGLVVKEHCRDGGKFGEYRYDFYDYPQSSPLPGKPLPGKPDTGNPDTGNPPQVNTNNQLKTEIGSNTDLIKQTEGERERDFEKWLRVKFSGDPTIRNLPALIKHILGKGADCPEYREWQAEISPQPIDESMYAHLWS